MSCLGDFFEEDEPVAEIWAAFERGQQVMNARPAAYAAMATALRKLITKSLPAPHCVCGHGREDHRWFDLETGEEDESTPCGICLVLFDLGSQMIDCGHWREMP